MTYKLDPLPYAYNSLEPFIDEATMRIHHDKHHQAYTDNLNKTLANYPKLQEKQIEILLADLKKIPEQIRQQVINHGGGFYNHNFFWSILKTGTKPKGKISEEIKKKFGSFDEFKEKFSNSALTLFGSGWTWLILDKNNQLEIIQTKNQESPISQGKIPLITVDVWEHAYYLKYQNKRAEYISAFFNVINWNKVEELFLKAKS